MRERHTFRAGLPPESLLDQLADVRQLPPLLAGVDPAGKQARKLPHHPPARRLGKEDAGRDCRSANRRFQRAASPSRPGGELPMRQSDLQRQPAGAGIRNSASAGEIRPLRTARSAVGAKTDGGRRGRDGTSPGRRKRSLVVALLAPAGAALLSRGTRTGEQDGAMMDHRDRPLFLKLRREHRARKRAPEIAQHPAHDYRVAGRHRERADDGDKADVFQRLAALRQRLAEGSVRAAAPPAPEGYLGDDARAAENDDADYIRY